MSSATPEKPFCPQTPNNSLAATGLSLSAVGVVCWFIMLVLILSVNKEHYTGDGQRDLLVGMQNFGAYVLQVVIGLVGLAVTSVLSISGLVISVAAHNQGKTDRTKIGIGLGIFGMVLGVVLVVYRMAVWGLFSA